MAQLKEILEIEASRFEQSDFNSIFLVQEGTFFRAYEWSAWLCCRYINSFKVTRREDKSKLTRDGSLVFIGFPITSLEKYIPVSWELKNLDEKNKLVSLPNEVFDLQGPDIALLDEFTHWKQSIPMAIAKKQSLKDDLKCGITGEVHRMSDLLSQIISYPIEQKSPMECMAFVANLKQQIASLL